MHGAVKEWEKWENLEKVRQNAALLNVMKKISLAESNLAKVLFAIVFNLLFCQVPCLGSEKMMVAVGNFLCRQTFLKIVFHAQGSP